jgi:hypothetical protein
MGDVETGITIIRKRVDQFGEPGCCRQPVIGA